MDSDEQALWLTWQTGHTAAARNALIMHYSAWARMVARDVYLRVPLMRSAWHDCVQNAMLGLLEAIERFDPQRGAPFRPFARLRVRGAVFDGLRALRASNVQLEYEVKEHAQATHERLQSLAEDAPDDALDAFVSTTVGLALGFLLDAQSMPALADAGDAYSELEKAQLSASVAEAVEQLPERERAVMVLHYYHQLSFVEIAAHLALTKGRISQLHKRALERLRTGLRDRTVMEIGA